MRLISRHVGAGDEGEGSVRVETTANTAGRAA